MTKQIYYAILLERNPIGECMDACLSVAERAGMLGYRRMRPKYGRTDSTRNQVAQTFLSHTTNDDDTLVMLDNDHLHPWDVIEKLVAADKPVVGALAFKRGTPPEPCVYLHDPRDPEGHYHSLGHIPENAIGEVDCIGHAAVAIKRSALLALIAAGYTNNWWRYEYWADGGSPSEDMYFAKICAAAGVSQWIHTGVECPHHRSTYVTRDDWHAYIEAHPGVVARADAPRLRISIIIPTRNRPERLSACLSSLETSIRGSGIDVECIVVVDVDDIASAEVVEGFQDEAMYVTHIVNPDPQATGIPKWNMGASVATGDWLVLGADDLEWQPGWLQAALDAPGADRGGFVGFNDGHTDGDVLSTHYMLRRDFMARHHGGVLAIPHYRSWYTDVETTARAKRAGVYVNCADAHVEHHHPHWKNAPWDEVYARGKQYQDADAQIYMARAAAGFPDDFEPVIALEREHEAVAA